MTGILSLLFDEYTRNLFVKQTKAESQAVQLQYQKLKELAGEKEAIDIWDAAASEGAVMQEDCFQAGVEVGFALALELFAR